MDCTPLCDFKPPSACSRSVSESWKFLTRCGIVSSSGQIHGRSQHPMSTEPGAGASNGPQALEQEPRAHQQHETKRYLQHDQASAHERSPASAHHPARFRLQRGSQVDFTALDRRHQPEEHSEIRQTPVLRTRTRQSISPGSLIETPPRDGSSSGSRLRHQFATSSPHAAAIADRIVPP